MIVALTGAVISVGSDAVRAILATPVQCRCGRMTALVVNRTGESLCSDCDATEAEKGRAPCFTS